MTERQLQDAVLEMAGVLGWLAIHHRPARTSDSWRTAAQGNGAKGFPDTVLARDGRIVFAELKSDRGQLTADQHLWRMRLEANPHVEHVVWRPRDWADGTIERALR